MTGCPDVIEQAVVHDVDDSRLRDLLADLLLDRLDRDRSSVNDGNRSHNLIPLRKICGARQMEAQVCRASSPALERRQHEMEKLRLLDSLEWHRPLIRLKFERGVQAILLAFEANLSFAQEQQFD